MLKKLRGLLLSGALFALAVLVSHTGKVNFSGFQYTDQVGNTTPATLPFSAPSPNDNGRYKISGIVQLGAFSPRSFRIIPDDELLAITVNGQVVDLHGIPDNARKDWNHGFSINLGEYLHGGDNTLMIELGDHGGRFGLKLAPAAEDWRGGSTILLWAAAVSILMLWIARRVGLSPWFYAALVAGIVLRVAYLSATNFETRTHDVWAHLEYIEFFVNNWAWPPLENAMGGAWFHPPFYYFVAARFYSLVSALTGGNKQTIYVALQCLSLATAMGYLLFGLLIIQRCARHFTGSSTGFIRQGLFALAGLLFACWPSAILHGIRISNDAFLYLFFTAGMYYLVRWYETRIWRDLFLALLCAGLATFSKANGVVLVAVIACSMLTVWVQNRFRFSWPTLRRIALFMLPALIGAAIAFYPGVALKLQGKRTHTYVSNINNVGSDQIVGAEAQNLLWFDTKMFVTEPFTSPWDDKMGRQYFGNYLGKTGLFGEWRFDGGFARNSAVIISIGFLILSVMILYGFYLMPRAGLLHLSPLIYTAALLLAAISHMRMSFPVNIDFRYILPIIACYTVFVAASMNVFIDQGKQRLALLGTLTQLAFLLCSILFMAGVIGSN